MNVRVKEDRRGDEQREKDGAEAACRPAVGLAVGTPVEHQADGDPPPVRAQITGARGEQNKRPGGGHPATRDSAIARANRRFADRGRRDRVRQYTASRLIVDREVCPELQQQGQGCERECARQGERPQQGQRQGDAPMSPRRYRLRMNLPSVLSRNSGATVTAK